MCSSNKKFNKFATLHQLNAIPPHHLNFGTLMWTTASSTQCNVTCELCYTCNTNVILVKLYSLRIRNPDDKIPSHLGIPSHSNGTSCSIVHYSTYIVYIQWFLSINNTETYIVFTIYIKCLLCLSSLIIFQCWKTLLVNVSFVDKGIVKDKKPSNNQNVA